MKKFRWIALLLVLLLAVSVLAGCGGEEDDDTGDALKPFPEFTILAGDSEVAKLYAEGMQALIEQNLGIPVNVQNVDFATRLEMMRNGQFSMVYAGWGADYNDPMTFMDMWVTDGPFNDVGWSNADYDALIQEARTSTDNTARMEAFKAAEELLAEELPIIPLYWPTRNWVQKDYVHDWTRKTVGADNDWKYAWVDKDENALKINLGENPPDLDPQTSTDAVSFDVLNAVLDGLFRIDAEGVLQPALAADFPEVSEDGTHYVFKIREGAEWSDGEPITAHDFEYAWKRAMNPLTGSQYNYQMEHIKGAVDVIYFEDVELPKADEVSEEEYATAVEEYQAAIDPLLDEVGVKAVDDHTLEVDLVQPTPFFLDLTSFITYLPAPMHLEQELGDKYAINADNMAFSGPFMITEWVPDDHITLEKNPNYWDAESVKLEKINMYMIKEISTYLNMYETGELDATGIPGSYLDQYKDDPGYGNLAEAVAWYIMPNLEDPMMGNKKFRQAVNAAFDRQAFVDGVLENGSFPATAYTPPSITDANGDSFHDEWVGDLLPTTADTELARQLLEEVCAELGYEVPSVE